MNFQYSIKIDDFNDLTITIYFFFNIPSTIRTSNSFALKYYVKFPFTFCINFCNDITSKLLLILTCMTHLEPV